MPLPQSLPLTRRANLLRALHGQEPDWIPFSLNFCQWFEHQRVHGTLPEALRGCTDHIDAHLRMGNDVFTRNFHGGFNRRNPGCQEEVQREELPLGTRTTQLRHTPHGVLRSVSQEQRAISTSHQEVYPVRSWAEDGAAFRWWLDRLELAWDPTPFIAVADRIGAHGVANLPLGATPLKFLHQEFGLDGSCLFVADHPEEAQAVCDAWWARLRPLIAAAAAHPRVDSVILMDNVDTPFYAPRLAKRFWTPYVAEATALMRQAGKLLFVHACGKLAGLAPCFAEARVSGLEGIAHAPLGDWDAARATACHPDMVYIGGFSACEQALSDDALRDFYGRFLPTLPRRRVVFSSSCNTEIRTRWDSILLVRDLVRAWGGRPPA
jgi:hypothetical protein